MPSPSIRAKPLDPGSGGFWPLFLASACSSASCRRTSSATACFTSGSIGLEAKSAACALRFAEVVGQVGNLPHNRADPTGFARSLHPAAPPWRRGARHGGAREQQQIVRRGADDLLRSRFHGLAIEEIGRAHV